MGRKELETMSISNSSEMFSCNGDLKNEGGKARSREILFLKMREIITLKNGDGYHPVEGGNQ